MLIMSLDAMNIQVHTATGSSPYELVFGQKPRSVLFPSKENQGLILEEDLEYDGVSFEHESPHEPEANDEQPELPDEPESTDGLETRDESESTSLRDEPASKARDEPASRAKRPWEKVEKESQNGEEGDGRQQEKRDKRRREDKKRRRLEEENVASMASKTKEDERDEELEQESQNGERDGGSQKESADHGSERATYLWQRQRNT